MATSTERTEFQRSAGSLKPVAFPEFPGIPDVIKKKFPDLLPAWNDYEKKSDQFRIKLQNILRFGDIPLDLAPLVPPVVVFPPTPGQQSGQQTGAQGAQGKPGTPGPQGFQGEPGDTVIVPPPPTNTDDEALVLATVGV